MNSISLHVFKQGWGFFDLAKLAAFQRGLVAVADGPRRKLYGYWRWSVTWIGDSVQAGVDWKVAWRFRSRNGGSGGLTIALGNDGLCIWDGEFGFNMGNRWKCAFGPRAPVILTLL